MGSLSYSYIFAPLKTKKYKDGFDPLYKVRPLSEHLAAVFPIYFQPVQQISEDKMMIGT